MSSFWVPMSKLVRVAFAAVLSAGESDVIILGPNVKTCGLCFLCGRILAGEPDVIILGPNVKTCGPSFIAVLLPGDQKSSFWVPM